MAKVGNGVGKNMLTRYKVSYLPWIICALAGFFYFYEYLLRVAPSVMSLQVRDAYHLTARSFGNLWATFYYIYAPMQIVVGLLMDRYGPRNLLTLAAFSCSMGAYLFVSSHYLFVAEAGRFLIGFGSAFAFIGVMKLAAIWLPVRRFAFISGLAVAFGMVGGIAGDLVLTSLLSTEGWRLTHYWVAILGLLLTLGIFLIVRDRPEESNQVVAHAPRLSLQEICFGCWQLMKNRQIWINVFIGFLMYLPLSGFAESWQIPFLTRLTGFTQEQAATASAMVFLGWAIGGPLMGWFSDTIHQRRLPITFGAAVATVLLALVIYVPEINRNAMYSLLFIFGVFSSAQAIVFPISREITADALSGTAIAFTNMIVMLAGVSVWIIGALLEFFWKGEMASGVHVYSVQTYQLALSILPIGLLLAVFLSFFLDETYCRQKES